MLFDDVNEKGNGRSKSKELETVTGICGWLCKHSHVTNREISANLFGVDSGCGNKEDGKSMFSDTVGEYG